MGFSPLADMSQRIPPGGRQSPRGRNVVGFTIHHQAGVNSHGEASRPGREVSANYWITNEGVILPNIDEDYRAWTTGAAGYPAGTESDYRNITVEVSNSGLPNGHISDAAWNALIRLIADCAKRHGFPIVRGTQTGIAVHRDFVPTECPGAHIMNNLSTIIQSAADLAAGKPTPNPTPKPEPIQEDYEMTNTYLEATKNSDPGKNGISTVWAGERRLPDDNGPLYSSVWERRADASLVRLLKVEWVNIQACYKAVDRKVPLVKVHGNDIEQALVYSGAKRYSSVK